VLIIVIAERRNLCAQPRDGKVLDLKRPAGIDRAVRGRSRPPRTSRVEQRKPAEAGVEEYKREYRYAERSERLSINKVSIRKQQATPISLVTVLTSSQR
jgi:hypothetical protein